MIPEGAAVAHLVQLRNPDAVAIGGDVLGHDVHGDLAQIQIGADACRGRNAGGRQNIQNDLHG